jgi:Na+/melibiose symporter-like transporter
MKNYNAIIIQLVLSFIFAAISMWFIAIASAFFISFYLKDKRKISGLYLSISSLVGVFLYITITGFTGRIANSSLFSLISGIPDASILLFVLLAIEIIVTTLLASLIGSSFFK